MRLRSDDLTWREIDGELVILDLRSSKYLTTNASGAVLLKELVEERSRAELASALVAAFGISQVQAEADVSNYVGALVDAGLLEQSRIDG